MRAELVVSLAAALMIWAPQASAQDSGAPQRDFCADRPGKGTPTCILDQSDWQVELGLIDGARQRDDARTDSRAYGDALLRYGLTGLTELQIGVTPYSRETTTFPNGDRERAEGISDLSLGLRHSLANPDGSGLSVAIAGFVTAPTGARAVRADGFEGGVILPVSVPLNDDWALSLSPEIDIIADADGQGRHAAFSFVAGTGRSVGPWDLGVEIWLSRDEDPVEPTTQSTLDLTAVWSPPFLADAQLDFGLNFGLNDDSPDVEFGVGLARRF